MDISIVLHLLLILTNAYSNVPQDGVHQTEESATPTYTPDQHKLMFSQDIKYVQYRLSMERKVSNNISD